MSTVRSIACALLTARTPGGGKRVQHVHAEDDLLERAARDAAHEHDVAAVERHLARAHAEAALDAAHHPRHRREGALVPARRQRPLQPASVPAAGRAQDRDAQPASAHRRLTGARMWAGLRTLLIDNYDSYTFNLFHLLGEVNGSEPVVVRNDELPWEELAALGADNVVISPGPGRPERARDAGVSLDALRRAEVPVLGVCLGHQALAHVAGGTVVHAPEVMHGRLSPIQHDESALFAGIPQDFLAVRYHSLVVGAVPAELRVSAWTPDGVVMGLEHRARPAVRRAVPSRVGEHPARPPPARELPRPHPRAARAGRPPVSPGRRARGAARRARRAAGARVHRRRLETWCEPEAVFAALYGDHDHAVWLDSATEGPGMGRFSFVGAPDGPLGEVVRYDVETRTLVVERARGGSSGPRACSTTAGTGSRACGPMPPSCRSTSRAASPATSVSSSRPSAGAGRRTPRRCRTRRSCSATG